MSKIPVIDKALDPASFEEAIRILNQVADDSGLYLKDYIEHIEQAGVVFADDFDIVLDSGGVRGIDGSDKFVSAPYQGDVLDLLSKHLPGVAAKLTTERERLASVRALFVPGTERTESAYEETDPDSLLTSKVYQGKWPQYVFYTGVLKQDATIDGVPYASETELSVWSNGHVREGVLPPSTSLNVVGEIRIEELHVGKVERKILSVDGAVTIPGGGKNSETRPNVYFPIEQDFGVFKMSDGFWSLDSALNWTGKFKLIP